MANGTTDGNGNGVRTAVKSELMAWVFRGVLAIGTATLGWFGSGALGVLNSLSARHEQTGSDIVNIKHDIEILSTDLKYKLRDQDRSITDLQRDAIDHENRLRVLERPQAAVTPPAPPTRLRPVIMPSGPPPTAPAKPANFLEGLFH